jgi:hypothetical protein
MMMNDVSRLQLLCAIICAASVARVGTAQEALGALTLSGWVVRARDGAPIAGADVWLISSQQRVATDSSGSFRVAGLVAGPQLLQIRHLGYEVRRDTVTVRAGGDSVVRFVLREQSAQLDTVRTIAPEQKYVSPMLRGFEERRLSGEGGRFISDSVLRRNENAQLTSLITSRIPGLMIGAARMLVSSRKQCKGPVLYHSGDSKCQSGGAPDCYVSVFIDGVLFYSARMAEQGAKPIDLNHESISNFAGVEFYADNGTAPAGMHSDDEGCGSLWLWTRER